jgi:formylglycine-generating enzyme required for sulfatase activity
MLAAGTTLLASGCMWIGGLDDYHLPQGAQGDAATIVGASGPSCRDLAPICGPSQNGDCCASARVPAGTFYRSYDGVAGGGYDQKSWPATIHEVLLDTYEITVGRFRRFVDGYPGTLPSAGAGRNPHDPTDTGWVSAWNQDGTMPANKDALEGQLRCESASTWTSTPAGHEALPQNCINWFVAFAFCIWDGGRLPTEAEWNYAAAGGDEQRYYPWSQPPSSMVLDQDHAAYDGKFATPALVGLHPAGNGRWGHADLSGNLWEWNLDAVAPGSDYQVPCDGCAASSGKANRPSRGGCFGCTVLEQMRASARADGPPTPVRPDVGARCARDR